MPTQNITNNKEACAGSDQTKLQHRAGGEHHVPALAKGLTAAGKGVPAFFKATTPSG